MSEVSKAPVPKWAVIAAIVVAVFAVGAISRALGGSSKPPSPSASSPTPAATPTPSFAQGAVTESSVRAEISGIDLAEVKVQDNLGTDAGDDKIVHVTYRPAGVSDQSPRLMLADLAKVSAMVFEKLFVNPAVTAVDVTAQAPMVSADGSEKNEAGARIYWDRKKADSVDFAKYRDTVAENYFWDAYIGAPDFYVHPGVLAGLSAEDQAKLK